MRSVLTLVVLLLAGELLSYGWRPTDVEPGADFAELSQVRDPWALSLGLAITLLVLSRLSVPTSSTLVSTSSTSKPDSNDVQRT